MKSIIHKKQMLLKDPPVNIFNKPNNPSSVLLDNSCKALGSIPGRTTKEPNL